MIELNLWFSKVKLSDKIKIELLKEFKSIKNIYKWVKENKSINVYDNYFPIFNRLKDTNNDIYVENALNKIKDENIKVINFFDDLYPKKLKEYNDSPPILYFKGDISKLNDTYCVSMVGSRNCSIYGRKVSTLISRNLSKNNITIVSGMAKGIDFYSQSESLKNCGYSVGVLGCGIDIVYPKQNKELYNNLIDKGCIISEFPIGTKPFSYNFPKRNRIISGLSDIVIVVEAGEKSGSLITTTLALEQGKDVIAVPGSIFSKESIGTNRLIRDGAYVATSMEDIYNLIGIEDLKDKDLKDNDIKQGTIQQQIYENLTHEPIHIDDLLRIVRIDIKQLYAVLFELQLKNKIICLSGNYYVKS